jgi:hypothetical protein
MHTRLLSARIVLVNWRKSTHPERRLAEISRYSGDEFRGFFQQPEETGSIRQS